MSNYSDSAFDESNKNTSWYKVFSRIPEKSTVLDIGCSSGNFGETLIRKKQCIVDGVELFADDAKLAAKKLRNVHVLNIETDDLVQLKTKAYDIVYFGDVVEHLVNPAETLRRVSVLLKKDGVIIFSIPNMAYVGVRLELLKGDFSYTETGLLDKTHLHFYTQTEVERIFGEAGYSIKEFDFVEKDYPKKLLKEHLKQIGLSADEKFYEKMADTSAGAFQFIGIAAPSKTAKKIKRETFGPIDLFEKFYTDTVFNYTNQVKSLQNEVNHLTKQLEQKTKHPYRAIAGHYKKRLKK